MISVLCPSRERPELLNRSILSLHNTASKTPEILVAIDPDDAETYAHTDSFPGAQFWVAPERYGYDKLHEYYGALAKKATGDWLLIWNDDACMLTPRWDALIEELPAKIWVANLASTHSPLCCIPAIRREAVSALGRFSTENPHVDTFWGDIGMATQTMATVPVFASLDTPVNDQSHDFYSPAHQEDMARCAELLRDALAN